jgi:hypothetical protein
VNLTPEILAGLLLLGVAPVVFWVSGAALAARLGCGDPGERIATALIAGLAVMLALLSWVNLIGPIAGLAALLVLAPAALAARALVRHQALADLRTIFSRGQSWLVLAGGALFLLALLLPLLARPGVIYYDGTANHDGFFWVTGAEYLRQHSYLEPMSVDATHPYLNGVRALTGWTPGFGRMGAEGLVALGAAFTRQSPVEVYLVVSAALFWVWLAAVYLVTRRFIAPNFSTPALLTLALVQPLFAFFHHNANLPNLLGVLCGTGACLAVVRGGEQARTQARLPRWTVLWAALAGHGVLVSYPELAPFVALPGLLLLGREWRAATGDAARRAVLRFSGAAALGAMLLNPVTTLRAGSGFVTALFAAQDNAQRANIFASVPPAGWWPAWLAASPKSGLELGALGGAVATLVLMAAAALVFARARDRVGLAFLLAGSAVLALYTGFTGFPYGWQKTLQFAGVGLAAVLPLGVIAVLPRGGQRQAPGVALAAATVLFFAYASTIATLDAWKWSGRKKLERDWLALRDVRLAADTQIEPGTFAQPFFYGMWSTYFLCHTPVRFPDASGPNVGYLLHTTATEATRPNRAGARLVSRAWAEANTPTIAPRAGGTSYALLPEPIRHQ